MTNIAFNIHIHNMLKVKYSALLAIIPITFMLSSIGVLWLLDTLLGVDITTALNQYEHSNLLFAGLMVLLVSLMYVGYILGWAINALISFTLLKWPKQQIKEVYLASRVPNHWLKGDETIGAVLSNRMADWKQERKQGAFRYIAKIGVLGWGLFMFVIMAVIPMLKSNEPMDYMSLLSQAGVWVVAGALFGFIMWYLSEKQYLKYLQSKSLD